MTRKFRLRDVDGTTPGVCVMIVVDLRPDVEKTLVSVDKYIEGEHRPDPHEFAQRLWSTCEDDFPHAQATFAINERARYLMKEGRMKAMGFDPQSPQDYWKEYA